MYENVVFTNGKWLDAEKTEFQIEMDGILVVALARRGLLIYEWILAHDIPLADAD
ncbi:MULTISPECIES: hypothetical protein [Rhodopseudomonas]|uniref:hypothetical protein n=1 Tax=Rhodopseudomonas TaxID=1073 RepID=UPI000AD3E365|nr:MULTISPECIES: hypothetical protein [Rhodopseudomonas]MDF3810545.1 hypothetical protein [Rhodopseudomonas sp. BAL398]WOK18395.1 hypothetical protein RBJ75_02360 [Rhodopseudomonas sp. BAL398]